MKKLFVLAALALFVTAINAQEFASNIEEVTVYMNGAQITREAKIRLKPGISTIQLKGLSEYVDVNTIQAKLPEAKILNFSYKKNYLEDLSSNTKKQKIQDSLDQVQLDIRFLSGEIKNIEQELTLVEKNNRIKGQAVLDVADLEDFLIFYRSNLPLIRKSLLDKTIKKERLQKVKKRLQRELRNINGARKNVSGEVEVVISTNSTKVQILELSYYVRNAYWEPYYNIRAKALDEDITLEFNAYVVQNTGVDWKEVSVTLATGNPSVNGNAPVLNPWYLNYYVRKKKRKTSYSKYEYRGEPDDAEGRAVKSLAPVDANNFASYEWKTTENLTFQEYKIDVPYNIDADGKKQRIEIKEVKAPAHYQYYAVPKLDKHAYLMAQIPNWEQYKLLSGEGKIFYGDAYIGTSWIEAENVNDTLSLSLGQDKGIALERKTLLDKSKRSFIGTNQTKSKAYQIVVKNNKSTKVVIEILDQVPVAKRKEIKVNVKELSEGTADQRTGEVKWKVELAPGEKKDLNLEFDVTYPKKQRLSI